MIVCDTSVLVAAFSRWHTDHEPARAALRSTTTLIDHVAIEAFSVLTRLPPPRRVPPELVVRFLAHHFPQAVDRLPSPDSQRVIDVASRQAVSGGAIYDLVVALAAADASAMLLTLDRRAIQTYRAAGADYRFLPDVR